MNGRGGKREGSGRPVGWRKENSNRRKCHSLNAHDEEWELINKFARLVKYGDKQKAIKFLETVE